jgi:AraC-like DNA-binding protein
VAKTADVKIEYFTPAVQLRNYCTTIFLSEISVAEEGKVEDLLFPEWASLRFSTAAPPVDHNAPPIAEMRTGFKIGQDVRFPVLGPRTQEVRFRIFSNRLWSINLTPLGWVRYIGEPAHEFANVLLDAYDHPAFAHFRPLVDTIFGPEPDTAGELQRIVAFLEGIESRGSADEERILAIFMALLDPELTSVAALADGLGISQRTLERTCLNAFGFTPKVLLRRQRFMRSLADFTLDPSLKWIGAMDALYHDQAQFVRDFKQFMGMTPSEYAALDKPIMDAVIRERDRYSRDFVRTARRQGDMREFGVRE